MDIHDDWIHEVKVSHLREQLSIGINQIEQDDAITIESKVSLDALFDDIKT